MAIASSHCHFLKNIMKRYLFQLLTLFLVCSLASFYVPPEASLSLGLLSLAATGEYSTNALACITTLTFDKNCGSNPGGLKPKIYIVSKKDVDSIPAAVDGVITGDIVLKATETWAVWEGDKNMFKLDMNSVGEGDSKGVTSTLEMHQSGFSPAFEYHLSQQLNGDFIILAPDRKNRYRLLGDLDEGAQFPSDGIVSTTGANITDKNGNTLKWTYDSAHKPYFYEGTFTVKEAA